MNKFTHWLKTAYPYILDFIFPKYCLGCQTEGSYLCINCRASLTTAKGLTCFICNHRSPTGHACDQCRHKNHSRLTGILIASDWNNLLLRQIIYEYKYRFVKELADPLSELIIKFLQTNKPINPHTKGFGVGVNCPTDKLILIPVPLHPRRLAWRGFNQVELLTNVISQEFNIPIINNALVRHRYSPPQMSIADKKERQTNIQNTFSLSPKITSDQKSFFKNKTIILVDDICTTTSTLEECAKALQPLRPKEIWGLVIARG